MNEITDTENQWGMGMNWEAFDRAQTNVMARSDFGAKSHDPVFLARALSQEYICAERQAEDCEVEPMTLAMTIRAIADVQDVLRADGWPLQSAAMRAPFEDPAMTLGIPLDWHSIFRIIGDDVFDYRIRIEPSRDFLLARDQNVQLFRLESHRRSFTQRIDSAGKVIIEESSDSIVREGFRMPSGKDRVIDTVRVGDTIESSYYIERAALGKGGKEAQAGNEVAVANCVAMAMQAIGREVASVINESSIDHHVDAWIILADGQRLGIQVTTPESEQMFENTSHGESSGQYSDTQIADLIHRAIAKKEPGGYPDIHLALDCSYGFPALEGVADIVKKKLPMPDSRYDCVWIVNTGTKKARAIYPPS